mmetsp:Transcript_9240/g.30517  ORF Transcript_9240/g.30517 Transcript_9240/m.30517 type:complete len:289 (-) Transcript_9240:104-970(-)
MQAQDRELEPLVVGSEPRRRSSAWPWLLVAAAALATAGVLIAGPSTPGGVGVSAGDGFFGRGLAQEASSAGETGVALPRRAPALSAAFAETVLELGLQPLWEVPGVSNATAQGNWFAVQTSGGCAEDALPVAPNQGWQQSTCRPVEYFTSYAANLLLAGFSSTSAEEALTAVQALAPAPPPTVPLEKGEGVDEDVQFAYMELYTGAGGPSISHMWIIPTGAPLWNHVSDSEAAPLLNVDEVSGEPGPPLVLYAMFSLGPGGGTLNSVLGEAGAKAAFAELAKVVASFA